MGASAIGIGRVAQPVAEEVEGEDDDDDGNADEERRRRYAEHSRGLRMRAHRTSWYAHTRLEGMGPWMGGAAGAAEKAESSHSSTPRKRRIATRGRMGECGMRAATSRRVQPS